MSKTGKNVLLALLLSLVLSFIGVGIYIFYPLITMMLGYGEGAGIGAIGGAFGELLLIGLMLFFIIFALLQWKGKKTNY